jgi:long-chain fatty acid transport protein
MGYTTRIAMKNSILTIISLLLFNLQTSAGGFQVNLQGQKQTGMGHAGIGLALDNAAVVFNPGALIFIDSLGSFSAGMNYIIPRTVYLDPASTYTAQTVHHAGTPLSIYGHFKFKKNSPISFAIGVYNPFGSRVQWEDDWKGQFLLREISLKTFFYQPTISYQLTKRIGIGVGYIFANGDFSLRKGIPIQDSTGNYGQANLYGKAQGNGFNAGIFYQFNNKLSFGINYRSAVKVMVENGNAEFVTAKSVKQYFENTTFNTKLNLPASTGIGMGYCYAKNLKFAFDINYIGWKSYDSLKIDFALNSDKLVDVASPRLYKNSFIFRTGAQYQINNLFAIRAGIYFDQSPVKKGYLSPETPDSDKLGLSTGVTLAFRKLYFDASLLYVEGLKRTDTNIETQFEASYKTKALVPGFNIGIKF